MKAAQVPNLDFSLQTIISCNYMTEMQKIIENVLIQTAIFVMLVYSLSQESHPK